MWVKVFGFMGGGTDVEMMTKGRGFFFFAIAPITSRLLLNLLPSYLQNLGYQHIYL